jgi:hypothetical protein
LILTRALWIDNFEDGTFEDSWASSVSVGSASVSLQTGFPIKCGGHCLRLDFNLSTTDYARAIKTWTSPQVDLSSYGRIYFWIRSDTAGTPDVAIRQNGGWNSNITAANALTVGEWNLNYITLTGTRTLVDGIRFEFDDTEFGESDVVVRIDMVVAVLMTGDHYFNFIDTFENVLRKMTESEFLEQEIVGTHHSINADRGFRARQRSLTGEFVGIAQIQEFIDVLRSGDKIFFV